MQARNVKPLRQPDFDLLSKADVECIDQALARYGNMPFKERTELSHDAAWDIAAEDEVG